MDLRIEPAPKLRSVMMTTPNEPVFAKKKETPLHGQGVKRADLILVEN